jgi:hypothetical protein
MVAMGTEAELRRMFGRRQPAGGVLSGSSAGCSAAWLALLAAAGLTSAPLRHCAPFSLCPPPPTPQNTQVHLSSGQIARLIGRVFIEKSAVNLLSSVLDTPEYFW